VNVLAVWRLRCACDKGDREAAAASDRDCFVVREVRRGDLVGAGLRIDSREWNGTARAERASRCAGIDRNRAVTGEDVVAIDCDALVNAARVLMAARFLIYRAGVVLEDVPREGGIAPSVVRHSVEDVSSATFGEVCSDYVAGTGRPRIVGVVTADIFIGNVVSRALIGPPPEADCTVGPTALGKFFICSLVPSATDAVNDPADCHVVQITKRSPGFLGVKPTWQVIVPPVPVVPEQFHFWLFC